jgi:hypothetical protein
MGGAKTLLWPGPFLKDVNSRRSRRQIENKQAASTVVGSRSGHTKVAFPPEDWKYWRRPERPAELLGTS